jgi:hypothetical protein
MRIPLDQRIAEGIARGKPLVHILPEYTARFRELYKQIVRIVSERGSRDDANRDTPVPSSVTDLEERENS